MSNSDLDLVPAKIKIVLLGNSYTGKTSIIDSYVQNRYNQFYKVSTVLYSPPSP